MKIIKREIINLILVALLPSLLVCAFPLESLQFQASKNNYEPSVYVAFIELSGDGEANALRQARTSWQMKKGTKKDWRVRLRLEDLPEGEYQISQFVLANPTSATQYMYYDFPPYSPSYKSALPRILRGTDSKTLTLPTFSREELLKLNEREMEP